MEHKQIWSLLPCVNCGNAEGLPGSCYGWRHISRNGQEVRYEGFRIFRVGVCVPCLHRYYRSTYVIAGILLLGFGLCLAYQLAVVGRIGTGGALLLAGIALPLIVSAARAMNTDVNRAAAAYVRLKKAEDVSVVVAGNPPADLIMFAESPKSSPS